MNTEQTTFYQVSIPDPHIERRIEMLKKHPELRALFGPNPYSFLLVIALVAVQLALAWFVNDLHWALIPVIAFFIGTYITGSLNALIHDASHNLIFHQKWLNRIAAMIANLPLITVSAESFRRYHYQHHFSMGDYQMDVGIPTEWEARWVGNKASRKMAWLTFFIFFQLGRTKKFTVKQPFMGKWMVMNFGIIILANLAIFYYIGFFALFYLFLCFFFSFGFHPLGARVIQEHFMLEEGQETNNYSGKANVLECNFGCHNEHHDFPRIPWNRLPKVSKIAPEFYTELKHHPSRWKLIFTFISNPEWNLYRHTIRVVNQSDLQEGLD